MPAPLAMPRPLIIATLLGASVGVPYVVSQTKSSHGTNGAASSPWPLGSKPTAVATSTSHDPFVIAAPTHFGGTTIVPVSGATPPPPQKSYPTMEQVFRFDINKNWVYQHWARKSTSPTEFNLFAVRVALVTGTQSGSLAGSLTYFFNAQDQVEHISFRGHTGDARQFVQFMTSTYQLQSVQAPVGEQLYQVARGGSVQSELRMRPEAILVSSAPQSSLTIELELARPGSTRLLPPRPLALEIPPDTSSPAPATSPEANGASGAAAGEPSAAGSYLDNVRYATPEEVGQSIWRRWPN